MTGVSWDSIEDVRRAIAAGDHRALRASYDVENEGHAAVLLALTHEERCAFNRDERLVSIMGALAWKLCHAGRVAEAQTLYDAVIEAEQPPLNACATALWAIQNDNSHLGVLEARARRYLERCLPHGPRNPLVFYNAIGVAFELGDIDAALAMTRDAVRYGFTPLADIREDRMLAPLKGDPRFLAAFDDPELLETRCRRQLPTSDAAHAVAWAQVFDETRPVAGASEAELTALLDLWAPLTEAEATRLLPDPEARARAGAWQLSGHLPPTSYIDLLRWSNGGIFSNGDRRFSPFFEVGSLRRMMLGYQIPDAMPHVLPFAFDGGGVFCAFDMREPARDGEFPIVAFHASTPCWEETSVVAETFEAACRGRVTY